MIELRELDNAMAYIDQLQDGGAGPVVLVNLFHVPPDVVDAFIGAWTDDAAYMKRQPGYLDAQLHRGVGSNTFVNVATWTSPAALRTAFFSPEFQEARAKYPDGTIASPHLFRKLAVLGICAD